MYEIIQGDALEVARTRPDNSIHCIVTSPPYFALRVYDTAVWTGGDEHCEHVVGNQVPDHKFPGAITNGVRPGTHNRLCKKCGAVNVDQQLGLENSVEEYIARLVELFHELKRVLHPSGVVFLNLGDSRAGSGGAGGDYNKGGKRAGQPRFAGTGNKDTHFKPKDLMMVPERTAIALHADGWWIRSKIIWHRENNMPENVQDRPSDCYEEVFVLTKAKKYYWDWIAIREPSKGQKGQAANFKRGTKDTLSPGQTTMQHRLGRQPTKDTGWRNGRNIWTINPKNAGVQHYATMPVELAKKCILAGSSEHGVCSKCLAPYKRIIKKGGGLPIVDEAENQGRLRANGTVAGDTTRRAQMSGAKQAAWKAAHPDELLGWEPTCKCQDAEVVPATIYDPFAGAGTTLLAAELLGRNSVGSELSANYIVMAHERIARDLLKYKNPNIKTRAREGKTIDAPVSIFEGEEEV